MKYQAGDIVVQCGSRFDVEQAAQPIGSIFPNGIPLVVINLSAYQGLKTSMSLSGYPLPSGYACVIRYDNYGSTMFPNSYFSIKESLLYPKTRCSYCKRRLEKLVCGDENCRFNTFEPTKPSLTSINYIPESVLSLMPHTSQWMYQQKQYKSMKQKRKHLRKIQRNSRKVNR